MNWKKRYNKLNIIEVGDIVYDKSLNDYGLVIGIEKRNDNPQKDRINCKWAASITELINKNYSCEDIMSREYLEIYEKGK